MDRKLHIVAPSPSPTKRDNPASGRGADAGHFTFEPSEPTEADRLATRRAIAWALVAIVIFDIFVWLLVMYVADVLGQRL